MTRGHAVCLLGVALVTLALVSMATAAAPTSPAPTTAAPTSPAPTSAAPSTAAPTLPPGAELLVNGGFEQGFTGWHVWPAPTSWLLTNGTLDPPGPGLPQPLEPPSQYAALAAGERAGSRALWQHLVPRPNDCLSWRQIVNTSAPGYASNAYGRVVIRDTATWDPLLTAFATPSSGPGNRGAGSPAAAAATRTTTAWQHMGPLPLHNVSCRNVTLSFEQQLYQHFVYLYVDDVSVQPCPPPDVNVTTAAPTPLVVNGTTAAPTAASNNTAAPTPAPTTVPPTAAPTVGPTAAPTGNGTAAPTPATNATAVPTTAAPSAPSSCPALAPTAAPSPRAPDVHVCSQPNQAVSEVSPVTDNVFLGLSAEVAAIKVSVRVEHAWVSDLRMFLTHAHSGKSVLLYTQTPSYCPVAGVDVLFTDDGTGPAVDRCRPGPNGALSGAVTPFQSLSKFVGGDAGGDWSLRVIDVETEDNGILLEWCLQVFAVDGNVTTFAPTPFGAPTSAAPTTSPSAPFRVCRQPQQPVSVFGPVIDFMTVDKSGRVGAVKADLVIAQSQVGALNVTLTRLADQEGSEDTSVRMYRGSTSECARTGMDVTFTDFTDTTVAQACRNATPGLDGDVRSLQSLGAFEGMNTQGVWRLNVEDWGIGDTGVVQEWCLEFRRKRSSSASRLAVIVGACVLGLALLVAVVLGVLWHRQVSRRRREQRLDEDMTIVMTEHVAM